MSDRCEKCGEVPNPDGQCACPSRISESSFAAPPLLGCRDKQLAERLGSVCVSGDVLTGDSLVKYLNQMPAPDKESMLEDLALLKAMAIMEKNVPDESERVTAHPNDRTERSAGNAGRSQPKESNDH